MMDSEFIRNGLMALQWLTTCWLAFYTITTNKQRASNKTVEELHKRIDEKCERIAKIEGDLKAAPTRQEVTRIHERIDEIINTSRENNLLLGQVLGQLKQINGGK